MESLQENSGWPQKILLAQPRGFCAGVVRAVDALWKFHKANQEKNPDAKTYSYHQIVHNTHVVRAFEEVGVVFTNNISAVPEGADLMLSAHGVSPEVRGQARERGLNVVDTTCPLVDKPHREARSFAQKGYEILYIGHAGHDETVGLIGEAPAQIRLIETIEDAKKIDVTTPNKVALLTQTTLSIDDTEPIKQALRERFPNLLEPPKNDICYASQNRQDGVKTMVQKGAEIVVVVGSGNSSNSKRLAEVALSAGAIRACLVDDASELKRDYFFDIDAVGLISGASVPDNKFQEVVSWFLENGTTIKEDIIVANEEKIRFTPPK